MKLNITNTGNPETLKLSGTLDINAADALRDTLAQHVQQRSALTLDLSEVDGCDVAGLQLLCSARKSTEAACQAFEVTTVSQAVIDAFAALGLSTDQLKATPISI